MNLAPGCLSGAYLVGDIGSDLSPVSVHLLEESQVIVAIEKLVTALFRLDGFQAGMLQYYDDTLLGILLVGFLEPVLLGFLQGLFRHVCTGSNDRFREKAKFLATEPPFLTALPGHPSWLPLTLDQ